MDILCVTRQYASLVPLHTPASSRFRCACNRHLNDSGVWARTGDGSRAYSSDLSYSGTGRSHARKQSWRKSRSRWVDRSLGISRMVCSFRAEKAWIYGLFRTKTTFSAFPLHIGLFLLQGYLLLLFCAFCRLGFLLWEYAWCTAKKFLFPVPKHIRIDLVCRRYFLQALFLADNFEDELRLVFCRVCFSCHGSFAPFVLLYHVHDCF